MKRVFPSQHTQNYTSQPQLDDNHKTDYATALRLHQSTISKGPLSVVPSEANQSFYQIIEKYKLHYLELNKTYNEMRFMEQMTGLKSRSVKNQLLQEFMSMFDDMVNCLVIIQNTIFQINFDAPDFQVVYDLSASNMVDILFKDIKTLEGLHLEMVYSSPLRYMETVLEALQFDLENAEKINSLDIKNWSQKCLGHLQQCKQLSQKNKKSKSFCCCFK
ncbi:hypothetical protein pb186bvf_016468 [Paramecium bursaria]